MVNIEYIEGQNTFQINNVTLVRNFHSYVAGTKIRVVNAYDTTDELLPYTLFSEISVNGVVYNSTIELAEILSPILFLKQGGSGTGTGGVTTYSGNIITKTVAVPIDWTLIPETQIVDFVNAQEFAVFSTQRILFKAVRITGDLTTSNSSETYFWEFKPGKGNYGVNGTPVTVNDIEYISYVTNYQNNVIDLGEIGSTPIEVFVNDSGPYALSSSALNIFKATRSSTPVNYIYIGSAINIGTGATQSVSSDYIDVNAEPVSDPARVDGVGLLYDWSGTSLGVKREDDASFVYTDLIGPAGPPGVGGSGITKRYATYTALVADQANQIDKGIYHASDASGFSTVDAGYADFEYLGTTLGTEADYRKLSEEESMDIVSGSSFKTDVEAAGTNATPIDADLFGYLNSAAANVLVKFTWANIKAALKTYFDGLYVQTVTGTAVDNTDPNNPVVNIPAGGSNSTLLVEPFTYSGSQSFTVAFPITQIDYVLVGNSSLQKTQYSISGSDVTILDTLETGAEIEIGYWKDATANNTVYSKIEVDALLKSLLKSFTKYVSFNDEYYYIGSYAALVSSKCIYYNGATYMTAQKDATTKNAPAIFKWKNGVLEYATVGAIDNADGLEHSHPAILEIQGYIYIFQVNGHGKDIKIWKSNTIDSITGGFTLHHTITGTFGYCNPRLLADGRVIIQSRETANVATQYGNILSISAIGDYTTWTNKVLTNPDFDVTLDRHYTSMPYTYGTNNWHYIGGTLRNEFNSNAIYTGQFIYKTQDFITYYSLDGLFSKNIDVSGNLTPSEIETNLMIVGTNQANNYVHPLWFNVINDVTYSYYYDAATSYFRFMKTENGVITSYPCEILGLDTTPNLGFRMGILFNGFNLVIYTDKAVYACDMNFGNTQLIKKLVSDGELNPLLSYLIPSNLNEVSGDYLIGGSTTGGEFPYYITNNKFKL